MSDGLDLTRLIKEYRQRHGLTQRELASLAGVDDGTIHRWESGSNRPRGRTLRSLLEVLNHPPRPRTSIGDARGGLVKAFDALPGEQRDFVLGLVMGLSSGQQLEDAISNARGYMRIQAAAITHDDVAETLSVARYQAQARRLSKKAHG